MQKIINTALKFNLWNHFDVQFAYMISKNQKLSHIHKKALILASACLSSAINNGHTCLPLKSLSPNKLFQGHHYSLSYYAWKIIGCPSIKTWEKILLSSSSVSNGTYITPLILKNKKLYTLRMWQNENTVTNFFCHMRQPIQEKEKKIINVLNTVFPNNNQTKKKINWQKIAVTIAIINKITLIFGGAGTGKTFTITKLLISLVLLNQKNILRIKIAATTGKAARKLNESIITTTLQTKLTNKQKQQVCQQVTTLHKLLKITLNNKHSIFQNNNKLNADVIIIDEASMINLSIMANLIKALPQNARVVLIGDHSQLSPVEPGCIIQDLYKLIKKEKYSKNRTKEIFRLTGYILPHNKNNYKQNIFDNSCLLKKNYRFNKNSGINNLATAINKGNIRNVLQILNSNLYQDVSYFNIKNTKNYQNMIKKCTLGYLNYLNKIKNKYLPKEILKTFNEYRILCVLCEGIFGVSILNKMIEINLNKQSLIKTNNKMHYIGRPIIIIKNNTSLNLFNGDTGVLLPDNNNKLCAYFLINEENIKKIPIQCLPEHETNFVMTVHKSQGSEFKQTSLILPNKKNSILTRELFYTATTRARQKFNLYATLDIIQYTVNNKIQRHSNLIKKIKYFKNIY